MKAYVESLGIIAPKAVYRNLTPAQLTERAVARGEGTLSSTGALVVTTGKYTGRSPDDRFVVDVPSIHDDIDKTPLLVFQVEELLTAWHPQIPIDKEDPVAILCQCKGDVGHDAGLAFVLVRGTDCDHPVLLLASEDDVAGKQLVFLTLEAVRVVVDNALDVAVALLRPQHRQPAKEWHIWRQGLAEVIRRED